MKIRKLLTIVLSVLTVLSLSLISSSCGGSKKGYKPAKGKVNSGTGMGNVKQKNKHVWGKKKR